jgi:predicted  nucleic acid-binding Zn-ribbon protein
MAKQIGEKSSEKMWRDKCMILGSEIVQLRKDLATATDTHAAAVTTIEQEHRVLLENEKRLVAELESEKQCLIVELSSTKMGLHNSGASATVVLPELKMGLHNSGVNATVVLPELKMGLHNSGVNATVVLPEELESHKLVWQREHQELIDTEATRSRNLQLELDECRAHLATKVKDGEELERNYMALSSRCDELEKGTGDLQQLQGRYDDLLRSHKRAEAEYTALHKRTDILFTASQATDEKILSLETERDRLLATNARLSARDAAFRETIAGTFPLV